MREFIVAFFMLAVLVSLVSCEQKESQVVDRKAEMKTSIDSLESVLKAAEGDLDEDLGLQMIDAYVGYAKEFEADTASVIYWYKAGEIAQNIPGKELYAVTYFANIFEDHPNHALAPQSVFLSGVAFDKMGDKERAAVSFEHFLEAYPSHDWAPDAQAMLQMSTDTTDLDTQVKAWLENANKTQE
ncbi:MAG: hypothetical protein EP346_11515 [Bacteroidetes bacterium]|nr:MAG: hypothetical protein EP346_11515 [Bacteroidota bacterium]